MQENNVETLQPKVTATLHKSTGAVALAIPIRSEGQWRTLDVNVALSSAPKGFEDMERDLDTLAQDIANAMGGPIQATIAGTTKSATMTLPGALAATIEKKMKETT